MQAVTILQKLYEKYLMTVRGAEGDFVPMIVSDENDPRGVAMVICRQEGDKVTPIAKLLTKENIEAMTPKHEASESLVELFEMMCQHDSRKDPSEFGSGEQNKMLDVDVIERLWG